jgi:alkylhydroperoxidase family enzyme
MTLHRPRLSDFSPQEQATLERIAKRMGQAAKDLFRPSIVGVQAHCPAWLEGNFEQTLHSYRRQGVLPTLAKEAMHVTVSVTNRCNY